jgi:hypothetical protein
MIILQFLTENFIQGGQDVFQADFFFAKSQHLTPEMDSRAKTKYKIIMQYYFFSIKIKSFVSNFFWKTECSQ